MSIQKKQGYFAFSRKERIGMLTLLIVMIGLFVTPSFIQMYNRHDDPEGLNQFRKELASLVVDDSADSKAYVKHAAWRRENDSGRLDLASNIPKRKLFYFDPNKIGEEEWKALGLNDRTISTIQHYLSKGGQFRRSDDLRRIYGLRPDRYQELSPYIRIRDHDGLYSKKIAVTSKAEIKKFTYDSSRRSYSRKKNPEQPININTADTTAFVAIRGIGHKLANRIISFREKLGGFYDIKQLGEVYGLPDSVFQQISPFLTVGSDSLRKIDLNEADIQTLQQHPYIRWTLAKVIIQYRQQHGAFEKTTDLQLLNLMDTSVFQKLLPYLKIGKE
jgi:competence ComEA-like helix-hairpin-helix protein